MFLFRFNSERLERVNGVETDDVLRKYRSYYRPLVPGSRNVSNADSVFSAIEQDIFFLKSVTTVFFE